MGSAAVRPFLHDSRASPRSGSKSAVTSGPVKRTSVIALGAGLWLLGAVPGALASGASPPQPTDPKASSPAGTVYEIPLDAARSDAAPHRRASGGGATGGGGGGAGSSGGSSSGGSGSAGAPGSAGSSAASGRSGAAGSSATGSSAAGGSSAASGGPASATDPGSFVHSENGFGASSQVPGLGRSGPAAPASPSALSGGGGGSAPTGSLVLIGVVLLVGAYAGIFAGRRARA
jgi:hypothetical protein